MFLDEVIITVKSGDGGRGCESYLRRADRKMIPTGGDGGDGGDVIVRADRNTGSLLSLKSRRIFEAERGSLGKGSNKYGHQGKSLVVLVPCGTTVYDYQKRLLLRDLVNHGDEVTVAKGGRGGYGNHLGRPATFGKSGETLELFLSFTVIADIVMVGLPGSGKTTLLKALTEANVEPASYPFATKTPCLGTYESGKHSFSICELPSIYSASHDGRGHGVHYLKHLHRAKLIFFVVDPLNSFAQGIKDGYDVLLKEVEGFNGDYLNLPRCLVVNKIDLKEAKKAISKRIKFKDPVFQISAQNGTGLKTLMKQAIKWLVKRREPKKQFQSV